MRVVTVAARHVAKTQGVATALKRVGASFRVAFKTGLLLLKRIENPVSGAMYLMARRAGNILGLMFAAKPGQSSAGLMTIQTNPVLLVYCCPRVTTKGNHG